MILESHSETVRGKPRTCITHIRCDRCLREDKDTLEIQEYMRYHDTGGYSNWVFGDMTYWEIDLCQKCIHDVLARWVRVAGKET